MLAEVLTATSGVFLLGLVLIGSVLLLARNLAVEITAVLREARTA
jgi:hypothetical protein